MVGNLLRTKCPDNPKSYTTITDFLQEDLRGSNVVMTVGKNFLRPQVLRGYIVSIKGLVSNDN